MLFKFGNNKLPKTTMIFNMGTATNCPSKHLGLCECINKGIKCYAEKPEIQYKDHVINYREKQKTYWQYYSKTNITLDIIHLINRRKNETKLFRFNESGDFYTQNDVDKLSYIAGELKDIGITTYGYTARKDLNFKNVNFLVKGSFHNNGNNGSCIIINKNDKVPKGFILCPGSCKTCNRCAQNNKLNIAFIKH